MYLCDVYFKEANAKVALSVTQVIQLGKKN